MTLLNSSSVQLSESFAFWPSIITHCQSAAKNPIPLQLVPQAIEDLVCREVIPLCLCLKLVHVIDCIRKDAFHKQHCLLMWGVYSLVSQVVISANDICKDRLASTRSIHIDYHFWLGNSFCHDLDILPVNFVLPV